jgi:hypothetical protein
MASLAIDRQHLPDLRFKQEDIAHAQTDCALYNEDRQIVIDGLLEFFNSAEGRATAAAKPESYAALKAKVERAIHETNVGETFTQWRRAYATKDAKHLVMLVAMAGPSRI